MGDFRKKKIVQTNFEEKKFCKEIPGKKIPAVKNSLIVYNAGRKILHHCVPGGKNFYLQKFREKILNQIISLTHPTHPLPSKVKWSVPWRV